MANLHRIAKQIISEEVKLTQYMNLPERQDVLFVIDVDIDPRDPSVGSGGQLNINKITRFQEDEKTPEQVWEGPEAGKFAEENFDMQGLFEQAIENLEPEGEPPWDVHEGKRVDR